MHGQGQSEKKALKAKHAELSEQKNALKSHLCAARATVTKFDQIAAFWQEIVLDDEERNAQQQRQRRLQQQQRRVSIALKHTKSAEVVAPRRNSISFSASEQTFGDDCSLLAERGLLLDLLPMMSKSTDVATNSHTGSSSRGGKRTKMIRDRCDSHAVDCSGVQSPEHMMPPMPPKPIEINIDFSKVMQPVEESESEGPYYPVEKEGVVAAAKDAAAV